jgi:alpha-D-xyloside xylohydrolase
LHGTTSRLPWDFPADAERLATEALRMRYRLMPYLYSAAVRAARTGEPMMRALLVDDPDDPAAWTAELEYRLGTDLLVAPMIDPSGRRHVYLPAGEWVDYWTGLVVEGGRHLRVHQPLERVPLFVRRDALIPVTGPADTVGAEPFADLTIVSWGGGAGRTVIHDVDGDTEVTATRDGDTLRIDTSGPARVSTVELAGLPDVPPPARILLNGKQISP